MSSTVNIDDKQMADYFRKPVYPLLLGRSGDLATVKAGINPIDLPRVENATHIKGQIVPFTGHYLPGEIQALPKYFTNDIPRNNLGTEPYLILNFQTRNFETNINAYSDTLPDGREIHLYFHELNFESPDGK